MEILTKSARETKKLGEEFANCLKAGKASWRVLALTGDLGTGKTTFVQGLARGLGIKKRILSPTFIMIRSYALCAMPYATFYHIDLYRVEDEKDVEGLGLEEIFADPDNLVTIEWAEKIKKLLPENTCWLKFEYQEGNKRQITISYTP